ncbi:hypothetical protein QUF58_09935 [Anaerolineales bacterium HSG24]|nr:hypothetical protein [Anaerolineales bacterium HSG24]
MLEFLRSIIQYDFVIYFLLALIAVYFVRKIWVGRHNRTSSIFSLEREHASSEIANGFIGLLVVFGLMMGVFYLSNTVIPPVLPDLQQTPTATPLIEIPDTPTPPVLIRTSTPTSTPTPTISLFPTLEAVTLTPPTLPTTASQNAGQSPSCPNPGVQITRPGNGATIQGMVQIMGAAVVENFDYYKFEYRIPGGEWAFVDRYNIAVTNGVLGAWNSDTVPPGQYELRLIVVDLSGNYPTPCVVRLTAQ